MNSTNEIPYKLDSGIVFEDNGVFIKWTDTYKDIEKYCTELEDQGDRVIYNLGEHHILNGLKCHLTSMRWKDISEDEEIDEITYFLGFDALAKQNIEQIAIHIKKELGTPNKDETEISDEIWIEWKFNKIHILLSTWERFAIHGQMKIGKIR